MKNIHLYRLQRLCDFVNSKTKNKYYQYQMLVSDLDLCAEDHAVDNEAFDIAENLRQSLIFLAMQMTQSNETLQINDPVTRGYYFSFNENIELSKFRWDERRLYVTDSEDRIKMHYLIIDFLKDIASLPLGTLKICGNYKCRKPFVSLHKNKIYCCPTCRSTTNNRNTRTRNK